MEDMNEENNRDKRNRNRAKFTPKAAEALRIKNSAKKKKKNEDAAGTTSAPLPSFLAELAYRPGQAIPTPPPPPPIFVGSLPPGASGPLLPLPRGSPFGATPEYPFREEPFRRFSGEDDSTWCMPAVIYRANQEQRRKMRRKRLTRQQRERRREERIEELEAGEAEAERKREEIRELRERFGGESWVGNGEESDDEDAFGEHGVHWGWEEKLRKSGGDGVDGDGDVEMG